MREACANVALYTAATKSRCFVRELLSVGVGSYPVPTKVWALELNGMCEGENVRACGASVRMCVGDCVCMLVRLSYCCIYEDIGSV